MIYLDNAATTRPSEAAIEDFGEVSQHIWGNPSSTTYDIGIRAKNILNESRRLIAEMIGASPEQIFFTSGSTEAANWIISQLGRGYIITSRLEHPCVHEAVLRYGGKINYALNDKRGRIMPDSVEELLKESALLGTPPLVTIIDGNNEIGTLQDTAFLTSLAHRFGGIVMADMTQSFAHLMNEAEFDVGELGVDFAFGSAHKFGGFKGTGFLYIKHPEAISPMIVGGGQQDGLRSGTENVAGIYAMARQFERHHDNMTDLYPMRKYFIYKLGGDYRINGDSSVLIPNIISVTMPDCDANYMVAALAMKRIYVSAGSACHTESQKPSRVLKAIGLSDDEARRTIRISFDQSLTKEQVDTVVAEIEAARNMLKGV